MGGVLSEIFQQTRDPVLLSYASTCLTSAATFLKSLTTCAEDGLVDQDLTCFDKLMVASSVHLLQNSQK